MDDHLKITKENLNITWKYDDKKVENIIKRAMAWIKGKVGNVTFSLKDESIVEVCANALLQDYCRYLWDGSGAYFESDYLSDILNLQILVGVENEKKKNPGT